MGNQTSIAALHRELIKQEEIQKNSLSDEATRAAARYRSIEIKNAMRQKSDYLRRLFWDTIKDDGAYFLIHYNDPGFKEIFEKIIE